MKYLFMLLFLTGCSTCDFVLDPFGHGQSYCFAKKAQNKYCKGHGGPMPQYTITPMSFTCADGTKFEGYENTWETVK